jgi:hypothetical protein
LYSATDIIVIMKSRIMRWVGHIVCMGKMRNANKVYVGKHEGKRLLGRHRYKWQDNFQWTLQKLGVDWVQLIDHRDQEWALVNMVMIL